MTKSTKAAGEMQKKNPQPKAVLLMGLPGAGKGTQAFRIVKAITNLVHFDTGGEIYRRITDPTYQKDPLIREQKRVYFAGILNKPEWVSELVAERIYAYSKEGKSLVFSGSPRTLHEAEILFPILCGEYGRNKVMIEILEVSEETARQRSLNRLVCANKNCRYPTTKDWAGKPCPNCGQTLPTQVAEDEKWKTELLDKRFAEYRERTLPAIDYLSRHGFVGVTDAEKSEEEITKYLLGEISAI